MIRVVSLFCGIGGADLGLYRAADAQGIDVEVVAAYDSWEPAVRVYNANQRHPVAQVADVKTMRRTDLPPHDLVIGGPPCQDHSLAGQRKCKCNVGGYVAPRCCLADFVRLAGDSPYIMENVVSRLINAPWSERLCAADFGDVTSRKRWFYSNYLLHVLPTPGPRRIRDIRDHAEDERVLRKRGMWTGDEMQAVVDDDDVLPTLTATDFHGTKNNGSGKPTKGSKIACKAGQHGHYSEGDVLGSQTARSWHGHDIRNGKLIPIATGGGGLKYAARRGEDDVLPSLTATSHLKLTTEALNKASDDGFMGTVTSSPHGGIGGFLKIGLRGNSASASAFEDDSVLGSVLANSWHANEASRIVGCRNPSLLEMQRAHSIQDDWDWCGATKEQRGKMIANSWPVGMAAGVCSAMLVSLTRERESAA